MSSQIAPTMTLEALQSVPLFASLDEPTTRELRDLLIMDEAQAGTLLFRAGDVGDGMYLNESGRVRVSVNDADGQKITLAELAGGNFFGEMALLDGEPRSADVTVIEDARFGVMLHQTFLIFTRSHPDVAINMLSAQTRRLRCTDELFRQRVSRNVNEEQEARMTLGDRAADRIASFGGSWKFIIAALLFLALWVIANAWKLNPIPQ